MDIHIITHRTVELVLRVVDGQVIIVPPAAPAAPAPSAPGRESSRDPKIPQEFPST